jgi:hypothetical protein
MDLLQRMKFRLFPAVADDARAARLDATSKLALSASLAALPAGARGWITLAQAQSLFSPMDGQYAFGEMDERGRDDLAAFAARPEHRAAFDFMPAERRLYFTRKA